MSKLIASGGVVLAGLAGVAQAGVQPIFFSQTRLEHTTSDFGDVVSLELDVNGDGGGDLTFEIFNDFVGDTNESWLSGIDFSRSGGFLTAFDSNDNGLFIEFEEGDTIGPANEDDIGFETRTYGQYEIDDFGAAITGGDLAGRTAYIGFGIFDSTSLPNGDTLDGNRYGYLLVEFGPLRAIDRENPAYIEILGGAIGGINQAVIVPGPGVAGMLAIAGALGVRRRR